ncbi:non-ribosomal peptide synthetase [Marssonina coronariae]|uniref:Non-ribosomal peptide synthetase n=1 Tax=Diplocarpon coronariae TaxID=2795749 RepID=A0A218Z4E5_9HELO|nr:non-ribosomal peptide synthetase [Marssonina coronariae]
MREFGNYRLSPEQQQHLGTLTGVSARNTDAQILRIWIDKQPPAPQQELHRWCDISRANGETRDCRDTTTCKDNDAG